MSEPRERIISALRRHPDGLSSADLSLQVGIHSNTVRHHLQVLADDGLIEAITSAPQGRGRPQVLYRSTRKAIGVGLRDYPLLASLLLELLDDDAPDVSERAQALGRRYGATLRASAPSTIAVWESLGFEPTVGADRIELRHCPYREAAHQSPRIICALHHGILEGSSDDDTSVELRPFAPDGFCHVFTTASKGSPPCANTAAATPTPTSDA